MTTCASSILTVCWEEWVGFNFFKRLYDMLWRLCQVCVWKWCIMTRGSLVKHTHIFNVIHFMQSVNFIMWFPQPIALSISCKRLLHIIINYVLIFCLLTCTYSGQICRLISLNVLLKGCLSGLCFAFIPLCIITQTD